MVSVSNFTLQCLRIWFIIASVTSMITLCPPPRHITESRIAIYCPQQSGTHLKMHTIRCIVNVCTIFPSLFYTTFYAKFYCKHTYCNYLVWENMYLLSEVFNNWNFNQVQMFACTLFVPHSSYSEFLKLWVLVSLIGKVFGGWIRDPRFNFYLHQKPIGVLI